MANNHAYASLMKAACINIDALNACGIYASGDLDNGVMVKLTKMAQGEDKIADGFEFEVEPAAESDLGLWIVKTPEFGGKNLEVQLYNDPRYFYNPKGEPMSIKKLVPGVDYVEFTKEAFTSGTAPDGQSNVYAKVTEGGKLSAASMAPEAGGYFEFVAKHQLAIGAETVPTTIMRYVEKVGAGA